MPALFPYSARTLQECLDVTQRASQRLFIIGHAPASVLARILENGWTPRAAATWATSGARGVTPGALRLAMLADVMCGQVEALYGDESDAVPVASYVARGPSLNPAARDDSTLIRDRQGFYNLCTLAAFYKSNPRVVRA